LAKVERNQFAVEVHLPAGRPLEETDRLVRRLETLLRADRRVTDVTSFLGTGSPRFHTLHAPNMAGASPAASSCRRATCGDTSVCPRATRSGWRTRSSRRRIRRV
jgi:multidrug efflux pump subunit AcrB